MDTKSVSKTENPLKINLSNLFTYAANTFSAERALQSSFYGIENLSAQFYDKMTTALTNNSTKFMLADAFVSAQSVNTQISQNDSKPEVQNLSNTVNNLRNAFQFVTQTLSQTTSDIIGKKNLGIARVANDVNRSSEMIKGEFLTKVDNTLFRARNTFDFAGNTRQITQQFSNGSQTLMEISEKKISQEKQSFVQALGNVKATVEAASQQIPEQINKQISAVEILNKQSESIRLSADDFSLQAPNMSDKFGNAPNAIGAQSASPLSIATSVGEKATAHEIRISLDSGLMAEASDGQRSENGILTLTSRS